MRVWVRLPPRDSRHACPAERCHGWCADLIESHLIESHLIESHLIESHLIQSHLIESDLVWSRLVSSRYELSPAKHDDAVCQSVVRHVRDRT